MKKVKILVLIILMSAVTITEAQNFQNGTQVGSIGIGLGSSIGNYRNSTQTPGISFQYEKGMWDIDGPGVVSLGGYLGFKGFRNSYHTIDGHKIKQKWNYTVLGIRSAYHYNGLKEEKVDVYGGVMLSYNILRYSYSDDNPAIDYYDDDYGSNLGFSLYIGGRYYFSDNIAAFAELGYGVSYLSIGVCAKF